MITRHFCTLYRAALLSIPLSMLAFTLSTTETYGQDDDSQTVPKANYSFLPEVGGERQSINLEALSLEIEKLGLSFDSALAIDASEEGGFRALKENSFINALRSSELPAARALGQGLGYFEEPDEPESSLLGGGMSAVASMIVLGVVANCAKLNNDSGNYVAHGNPVLGRSSMVAVQFARLHGTTDGLGRGQFDIRTTKFALCRNTSTNEIVGVPINYRWVFNVNGNSLTSETGNLTGPPPDNKDYKQRFHAEGIGIQLVLMQIDGVDVPANHSVYLIVQDACIDIWFAEEVGGHDIWVPASLPNMGVFCAGGYCKDVPPGLDATQ